MRRSVFVLAFVLGITGCGDNKDGTPDGGDDAPPDGQVTPETRCEELPALPSGTCQVSAGGAAKLIKGNVLTPTTVYIGGQVAIDPGGQIVCAGCNCAAGGETVITCPGAAISPGLINTHDHITFTQNQPYNDTGVRYEHRHQWRIGQDGKPKIPSQGSATADQVRWGELRFLMGGATSIVGSGGQAGLLRNLDRANLMEGLSKKAVEFDTFPLDDSGGTRRTSDCNYGGMPTSDLSAFDAYEPHTSEGIDGTARNEFLCESSTTYDTAAPGVSNNLVVGKTAMIHGIGLTPADYGAMATAGTGLIWSPRSNVTLYGDTARVTTAARLGVEIALGTDWMPSGSMSLLRELRCADSLNQKYYNKYFSDLQLWQMVTINAAAVTATDDVIGLLAPGRAADVAIFAGHGKTFRAVIDAEPADVALVIRGGKVLYGDDATVTELGAPNCDVVDVCGTGKRVCLMGEVAKTYTALQAGAGAGIYPAFSCGQPANEPSCTPVRPQSVNSSTTYTGVPSADDSDGDGIANATDKCPMVFDPIRPLDNGVQGDSDNDGAGDACDPCPLDANTMQCTVVDPNDRDHDGVANSTDNCPDNANADQADVDHDGKGNVCDACPTDANPGSAGCPATIYSIKNGTTPLGTAVRVSNALVTGKGANGFFAQVKEGDTGYTGADYSGVFVFTGTGTPPLTAAVVGARVTIDARTTSFQGQVELDTVTAVTVTAPGPEALPAPIAATYAEVKTGGTRAAALEGVIVSLGAASVSAVDATFGEFTLTAGADTLVVDDFLFLPAPAPQVGQSFTAVKGILALRQSASKLEPRGAADLTAGAPSLASLSPALSFARVGTTAGNPTFPSPLTVTLSGAAQGNTLVTVASNDAALTVANVTVLDGQTTAVIPVTAVSQSADVTVTATLDGVSRTAHVRVLGAAEVPSTVTLSPADTAVAPGGTVVFTVTLDVPAPAGGTQVGLAVNPAGAGTLPATVTVNANQVSATFNYVDVATSGTATVTATLGASTSDATVTVSTGANHLVINEVDYDNIGTDTAEYVEIFNPSGAAISLAGKQLLLINGNGNTVYDTIDLSSAGSLPANHYLVIAGANVTVPAPSLKIDPGWQQDKVQNGAPDGIALIDNNAHVLIDALSYEGSITTVALPGFAAPVSLVEGTAVPTATADSNTVAGTLCRAPNGQDTDNAMADWAFCATSTPGVSNP